MTTLVPPSAPAGTTPPQASLDCITGDTSNDGRTNDPTPTLEGDVTLVAPFTNGNNLLTLSVAIRADGGSTNLVSRTVQQLIQDQITAGMLPSNSLANVDGDNFPRIFDSNDNNADNTLATGSVQSGTFVLPFGLTLGSSVLTANQSTSLDFVLTGGSANRTSTAGDFSIFLDQTVPSVSSFELDPGNTTVAPGQPAVVRSTAVTSVEIALNAGEQLNASTFATSDLTLFRDGNAVSLAAASLSGSGASFTLSSIPDDGVGTYTLTLLNNSIMDNGENSNNQAFAVMWTVDQTPPTVAITLNAEDDTRRTSESADDFTAMDGVTSVVSDLDFTVTTSEPSNVTVVARNTATMVDTPAMVTPAAATPPTATSFNGEFASLPEGVYVVTATATDTGGNMASQTFDLTIDATDPIKPVVASLITNASPATLTLSTSGTDVIEDTDAVTVVREAATQATFLPGQNPTTNPRPDATVDLTSEATFVVQAFLTDLAGNSNSTTLISDAVDFVRDQTQPTFSGLKLDDGDNEFPDSALTAFVTTSTEPSVTFTLNDQSYQALANDFNVSVFHVASNGTETLLNTTPAAPATIAPFDAAKVGGVTANAVATDSVTIEASNLVAMFGAGLHTLRVRATDAAGNISANVTNTSLDNRSDIQVFAGFAFGNDGATPDAPSTPVLTDVYDLSAILDDGVDGFPSQVWQMGFDKTTQTLWVNTELGNRTFQIDPATGAVNRLDLSLLVDNIETAGNPEIVSVETGLSVATDQIDTGPDPDEPLARPGLSIDNPHGIFFDFDTAQTPRIWIAHRTAGGADARIQANQQDEVEGGRLSYYDLVSNEFVTYEFSEETLPDLEEHVEDLHAVFVDDTGVIWTIGTHSNAVFEVRVNTSDPTDREAVVIPHMMPVEMGLDSNTFDPHGIDVIVDERTGEKYVWLIAEGGSGRIALLRPDFVENAAPGGNDTIDDDVWITWDMDSGEPSRGTFLKVDNNETPGIPEDDVIVGTFPVGRGTNPRAFAGILQVLDPGSVASDPSDTSEAATLTTFSIDQIPGGTNDLAAINQPYLDREGNIYFIDRAGAIGRVDRDGLVPVSNTDLTPIIIEAAPEATATFLDPSDFGSNIGPTQVFDASPLLTNMGLLAPPVELDDATHQTDRSQTAGLDLYEVANDDPGVRQQGRGAFRGAFNATSVLYTSLAQNDDIGSTAFAETTRRRISVVTSDGGGRMAFQTMRNGSLLLTSRRDGELFDEQVNLTHEIVLRDSIDTQAGQFRAIAFDGDPSALREADGAVHVFGRNFNNNVVVYEFDPGTGLWDAFEVTSPDGTILVGNPVAFNDGDRGPAAVATTSDGSLLLYRPDGTVTDLTALAGGPDTARVYANPAIVDDVAAGRIYAYGADMSGNMVQYRFDRTGDISTSLVADTLVIPGGARAAGQTERDTRIVQDVDVVVNGGTRHVFATDGHSRLVHWEVSGDDTVDLAENVSALIAATTDDNTIAADGTNMDTNGDDRVTGYFAFQMPFVARVYSEVAPVVEPDGSLTVYGTNGGDLVLFHQRSGEWHAANLSKDADPSDDPSVFTPANFVFGASGAYVDQNTDRHSLQINAKGEVVEYIFDRSSNRFSTQNINLARNNSTLDLTSLEAPADLVGGATETIIDNGGAGYSVVLGSATPLAAGGFVGDADVLGGTTGPNDGTSIAQWEFTGLAAGSYRVSATWTPNAGNAGNSVFVVIADDSTAGQVRVNQQQTPEDFANNGEFWTDLLTSVEVNDGTLTVLLGDDANGLVIADAIRIERLDALHAAGGAVSPAGRTPSVSAQSVDALLDDAVSILSATLGLSTEQTSQLQNLDPVVTDLAGSLLGGLSGNQIFVDVNAAGHGWFVDTTPSRNEEFSGSQALAGTAAAGRIDLLTVLMHEMGHALGYDDTAASEHSLMSAELGTGVRRLPVSDDAGRLPESASTQADVDDQFAPAGGVISELDRL